MSPAKSLVRATLARRGLALTSIEFTPEHRRSGLLTAAGIDLLVDVGANVGQYASQARAAGYAGRILSLEPLGAAYDQLEATASHDVAWEARRVAVGSEIGEIELKVSENSVFSSVLPVTGLATGADPRASQVRTESVPVGTLDAILAGMEWRALAVKIDVQGFERQVLDGAISVLAEARIVELELTPREVYAGQMLMSEALHRMEDAGFVLAFTENLLRDPETRASLQFNGIFLRP